MAVTDFAKYIEQHSIEIEIIESAESTHTAQEAADVHGVPVSNIVKSLLTTDGKHFYLCLVPGDKRLDLDQARIMLSAESIRMANAVEVKEITGYSIGGVPPFGHPAPIDTYVMDGFDGSEMLVAAAGSANAVFKIELDRLKGIVNAK